MATIGVPSTELLDAVLTGAVFERIRIAVGVDIGMETLASLRKIESRGERGKTIVLTRAEFLKFLREWIGDLPGFPTE